MRNFVVSIGLFCAWSAAGQIGWTEERSSLDAETVARLVRELNDADFQVRRRATQTLSDGGAEVVEPLSKAMAGGSLEQRFRALDVLGKIYGRGEPETFDTIELVLEGVARSENASLATTAQTVLDVNYETRQRLALIEIRRLGGSVLHDTTSEVPPPGDADPSAEPRREIITSVVLNQDWTGGDEGLRHFKRLTRLTSMYRVKTAKVSDEAIEDLQQAIPGLAIANRGPACLGIKGTQFPAQGERCRISSVTPNSAAAKAGVQREDVITHFNGEPVLEFPQLIELIGTKVPGDKVPVTLERNGQTVNLTVELLPWPKGN